MEDPTDLQYSEEWLAFVAEIYYYLDINENGQISTAELDHMYSQIVDQGSGLSLD
jgi:hypothetical protein